MSRMFNSGFNLLAAAKPAASAIAMVGNHWPGVVGHQLRLCSSTRLLPRWPVLAGVARLGFDRCLSVLRTGNPLRDLAQWARSAAPKGLLSVAWVWSAVTAVRNTWFPNTVKSWVPWRFKVAGAGLACMLSVCYAVRWCYRTARSVPRTVFDGQDQIAFCAHCSPELMDDNDMMLGNDYEKRFLVPAACPRCSCCWFMRGNKRARFRIGRDQYQFLGTYTGMRQQRDRDVHCPMVNQLDIPNEYRFAHRFLQYHGGTICAMESWATSFWCTHTRAYRWASQWHAINDGRAATSPRTAGAADDDDPGPQVSGSSSSGSSDRPPTSQPPPEPAQGVGEGGNDSDDGNDGDGGALAVAPAAAEAGSGPTPIQRMRQLWQFIYDHGRMYPQSSLVSSTWRRTRTLVGRTGQVIYNTTPAFRLATLGVDSRLADQDYLVPPPEIEMAPVASPAAQAVGPVTHAVSVHNSQDRPSVLGILEGRSEVKKSVFPDANGEFPDLFFNKKSKVAQRIHKFFRKFDRAVFTPEAMDKAYQILFAGKEFDEIAMSKFSREEIEEVRKGLQTTSKPEQIGTRKANGKLEAVIKQGKAGRVVVDNTLQLLAVNIISTSIFQHLVFDKEDGIFHNMSIKHRPRGEVLDEFAKVMANPWGTRPGGPPGLLNSTQPRDTCAWEIDQTGMELHERCNRHGEGLLGYTYNLLMRINDHVAHKLNAEFVGLHSAKIVLDVKTGMRIRFRMRDPGLPKDQWFTAKFPDMYLDSGWALTSGVNFINELSGTFASICENPEHLFAWNERTKRFRLQDKTFDWVFKSIPLYQTHASTEPSSFAIKLRGVFEGDDGGGAASRCLADPRNGGEQGLIIREQENLGYSAKLKTIVDGRVEIIGAHFAVENGLVKTTIPWVPAVKRYTSKLGTQTNVRITPNSQAARFLSLASMFAGRIEPFQRAFELSAIRVIQNHGKDKGFWTNTIRTDGYHELDRAFGDGTACTYTMQDVQAHYHRCANVVHQTADVQVRMLNMSIAEDANATVVTRSDYAKLSLFADECREFGGDDEAAYSILPASFR